MQARKLRSEAARARLVTASLLILSGCGGQIGGKPEAAGGTAWSVQKDPMGFSVSTPPGWTVRGDRSGRIEIRGGGDEQVFIWPLFIPTPSPVASGGPGGAPRLDTSQAAAVLQRYAVRLWPEGRWAQPDAATPSAVRLRGRAGSRVLVALLTWVATPQGAAGCVYGVAAPDAAFRAAEADLGQILDSFRLAGASTPPPPPGPSYVRWQDQREQAFTLEVPAGWKTSGGMFRASAVQPLPYVESISPDGRIRITGGDPTLPTFTVPNAMLQSTGFREGSWYSPGYGVRMMVMHYMTGQQFAAEYVKTNIGKGCAGLSVTEGRDRSELAQAVNGIYARYSTAGIEVRLSMGDAAFSCTANGQPMRGYYVAGTQSTGGYGGGIWVVEHLYGFVAAIDQIGTAQTVLDHMLRSFQVSPEWAARQQGLTAAVSNIVTSTNAAISKTINETYANRQASQDELSRRRSNATLGVEDVVDTATGRELKVESGSNYYWIDERGQVVGTTTDTKPSIDFRSLIRLQ
jgi:hypothetical protein